MSATLPFELALAPNPRTRQVVLWIGGTPYALTVDQAEILAGLLRTAIEVTRGTSGTWPANETEGT